MHGRKLRRDILKALRRQNQMRDILREQQEARTREEVRRILRQLRPEWFK